MLEYPMKSGILEVQRRGNLADLDFKHEVKKINTASCKKVSERNSHGKKTVFLNLCA
jgi:hypothetical protein